MAAFVTVHAGYYGGLQEKSFNISNFELFVFFYCRHKMKYICYQDSSVIWFVCLAFGLSLASTRNSTKVKVQGKFLTSIPFCKAKETYSKHKNRPNLPIG